MRDYNIFQNKFYDTNDTHSYYNLPPAATKYLDSLLTSFSNSTKETNYKYMNKDRGAKTFSEHWRDMIAKHDADMEKQTKDANVDKPNYLEKMKKDELYPNLFQSSEHLQKFLWDNKKEIIDLLSDVPKDYKACSATGPSEYLNKFLWNNKKEIMDLLSDVTNDSKTCCNKTKEDDRYTVHNTKKESECPNNKFLKDEIRTTASKLNKIISESSAMFMDITENKQSTDIVKSLQNIHVKDVDMYNTLVSVIKYISDTYSDKYEKSFFQPINITRDSKLGFGMNIGNASKYIARYSAREGEKVYNKTDLYKALHYIVFEITRRNGENK